MNPSNESVSEGITLVYTIHAPKGCGPDYTARFYGANAVEAEGKADEYLAKLPEGYTVAAAVERRLGH